MLTLHRQSIMNVGICAAGEFTELSRNEAFQRLHRYPLHCFGQVYETR